MSKIKENGILSGHTGIYVYREMNGKQVVQSMPSHYRDANTDAQKKQSCGMRNILAYYRLLKDVIVEQFEDSVGVGRSAYHSFLHHNILLSPVELPQPDYNKGLGIIAPYIISFGSLPPLEVSVEDGSLQFSMKSEEWEEGDILLLIKVECPTPGNNTPSSWSATHVDEVTNEPENKLIKTSQLPHGAYAHVHICNTVSNSLVSSQRLLLI
mgnify:CR=1 FL=1